MIEIRVVGILAGLFCTTLSGIARANPDVIELACPDMAYFANPAVSVIVTRDEKTGDYIYRYQITPRAGDDPVQLIALRDFAESHLESWEDDFALCNQVRRNRFQDAAVFCLPKHTGDKNDPFLRFTLRSQAAPGTIAYDIESASGKGVLEPQAFERFKQAHRGDESAAIEALQEGIGSQCPSGQLSRDRDRRLVSVVAGPAQNANVFSAELRDSTIILTSVNGAALPALDHSKLRVHDPLGTERPIREARSAVDEKNKSSVSVYLSNRPEASACNVKALLVDGQLEDGRAFRTSVPTGNADCVKATPPTFKISLRPE